MARKIYQTVVAERGVAGGRRVELELRIAQDAVPGVLLLPDTEDPVPAALLLHGYSSRKEHLADGVGSALLHRGVMSLAIDLPLHGARADPSATRGASNPLALFGLWRTAVRECTDALGYLGARSETDGTRLGIAGYSLGSFLALAVAADRPSVRATVLAAGGDLPQGMPFASIARRAVDPLRLVRRMAGRPLLMVHGRGDRTVRPDQAERLFTAAGEPKEIRWYEGGHLLPATAVQGAADWLAERLQMAPGVL